jgi:putative flippase GtrA
MPSRAPTTSPNSTLSVQATRYLLVGGVACVVDLSVMLLFAEVLGWHYLLAVAIGFVGGLWTNYQLSIRWVFCNRSLQNSTHEFLIFAAIGIVGLALTEVVIWVGKECLGCDYRLAKIVAVGVVLFWNFGLRKVLLFSGSGMEKA